MNEQQNEWKGGRREEGKETVAYLTPQIYMYICCGKKYFKQNWSVHFISSLNQYCPISMLAPVSLTFINNAWWYEVFAIVYQLWILVHLTDRPFSIRRGQRLLLICISLSLQSSSMSFQTQAGWRSSSLFGIISILRILHNPSWCSILLYHVTFLLTGEGPALSCLAVMYRQVIPIHSVVLMLTSIECNFKVQSGAASAEGGTRVPRQFPLLQSH